MPRRLVIVILTAVLAHASTRGTVGALAAQSDDLVCFSIRDPLATRATVVATDAQLLLSPPCRIDGTATQLCVPRASADGKPADSVTAARLCYRVECGDDAAKSTRIIETADGAHPVVVRETLTICTPADVAAHGDLNAADSSGKRDARDAALDDPDGEKVFGRESGCGDASGEGSISASDALSALRTAVGLNGGCGACACDVNDSGSVTASDALTILRVAVGNNITLTCPDGPFNVAWDGGGDGASWHDRFNWDGDAVPHYCDSVTLDVEENPSVTFTQGSLSIHSLTSAETLSIAGSGFTLRHASSATGPLSVAATLTLGEALTAADFTWTGGDIFAATTLTTTGTLTISGSDKSFRSGTLINQGTLEWPSSILYVWNGSILRNDVGGTANLGNMRFSHYTGDVVVFDNLGTLVKAGSGSAVFAGRFQSPGAINVNEGTLRLEPSSAEISGPVTGTATGKVELAAGTNVFTETSSVSGVEEVEVGGGDQTFAGAFDPAIFLDLGAGTLRIPADVTVEDLDVRGGQLLPAGALTVTNTLDWTGGDIESTSTITSTGTFTLSGSDKSFKGGTIVNDGAFSWPQSILYVWNGAILRNNAGRTLNIGDVRFSHYTGAVVTFDNLGTMVKAGSGSTIFGGRFQSSGTINLDAGILRLETSSGEVAGSVACGAPAKLELHGGTNVFTETSSVSGCEEIEVGGGDQTFESAFDPTILLDLGAGTLRIPADFTVEDLDVRGGQFLPAGALTVTNTLDWTGGDIESTSTITSTGTFTLSGSDKSFKGGTIVNDGTFNWPQSILYVWNGAILRNNAGRTLNIGDVRFSHYTGAVVTFDNLGTMVKAGSGSTIFGGRFQSAGTININAGIVRLETNTGEVAGSVACGAPAKLELHGGTNVFTETSSVSGCEEIEVGGGDQTFESAFDPAILLDLGAGTLRIPNDFTVEDLDVRGGQLLPAGALTVTNTLDWTGGDIESTSTITSTGTFTLSGSDKSFKGGTIVNDGTFNWPQSILYVWNGAILRNNPGRTANLTGDVRFSHYTGALVQFDNQGELVKSSPGDVTFAAPLVNSGTISIETGKLVCSSTYTQTAAGKLVHDVAGTDVASIGLLQGTTVNLDGEVEVNVAGGYTPVIGDDFDVMTYTTRNGTFATVSASNLPGGVALEETYGANALSFEAVTP